MRILYLNILSASFLEPYLEVDEKSTNKYRYRNKLTKRPRTVTSNERLSYKKLFCRCRTHFKSFTSVITSILSEECKDKKCKKITSHDGPQIEPNSKNIDLHSRCKPEEQSDSSHCYLDKESCQEDFLQITQNQDDDSQDMINPNQTLQNKKTSNNDMNAAFPGWRPSSLKCVSYLNLSDGMPVPPKPSAPPLDKFDSTDLCNMYTHLHFRLANLHVNDMKESYNMHMHSPPHPSAPEIDFTDNKNSYDMRMYSNLHQPSADNNSYNSTIFKNNHHNPCLSPPLTNIYAINNNNHTYMLHNSYPHQSIGPSESLHGCSKFSNTHVEPSSFALEYNENFNCNGKHVNIINGTCPYPINSAENTRAMPQPITSNFNQQRNILDNGNSTANINRDMLSNLISPENLISNSAPCDYSVPTKEDQIKTKIPNVNQNSRTNTNYNKYGGNMSESFLCQNQDIGKQNNCPYPTKNNIYTDVLLSPTNNLSNPMPIHRINSKHEAFENLNGPNYSSRMTYENKLVTINQEDKHKDIILNAPIDSQKNSIKSYVHSTVENYVNTQHKINKHATSDMKYGIHEKKPLEGRTSNIQEVKIESIQAQCKDKNSKQKEKTFADRKEDTIDCAKSYGKIKDESTNQISINDIVLLDDKTKSNSFKIVDGDKHKNAKIDENRRDGRKHDNDDIELKGNAIGDELHGKTISYNEKPNHNSCLVQIPKDSRESKLHEKQIILNLNNVGEVYNKKLDIASDNTQNPNMSLQINSAEIISNPDKKKTLFKKEKIKKALVKL